MTARWNDNQTGSTMDDVECADPELESRRFYRFCMENGREAIREFNTVTGDVIVYIAGQRPLRFVQRRIVRTTKIGEGRYERHV